MLKFCNYNAFKSDASLYVCGCNHCYSSILETCSCSQTPSHMRREKTVPILAKSSKETLAINILIENSTPQPQMSSYLDPPSPPSTACILRFPLPIPPISSFSPFPPSYSTHYAPTLQSTASARHLCLRWSHVHRVRTHNRRHAAINTKQCARRTALGCDVGDAQWVVWDCVS